MRVAAQIIVAYLILLVLVAIWRLLPLASYSPDIVVLFGAYLGLSAREELAPSVAGAIAIGYLADLLMGNPVGLSALTAGLVCVVCHLIQGRLLVRGVVFTVIFSALTALSAGILILAVRGASGLLLVGLGGELQKLIGTALFTGLMGPFVFQVCRQVDSKFSKTRRQQDAAATGYM